MRVMGMASAAAIAAMFSVTAVFAVPAVAFGEGTVGTGKDTESVSTTVTHDPQTDTIDFSAVGEAGAYARMGMDATALRDAGIDTDDDDVVLQASSTLRGDAGLSSVAVSWTQSVTDAEQGAPTVMLRYQDDGEWSDWTELPANIVDADDDDADTPAVQATDPMYVGGADAVEALISFSEDAGDVSSLMPKLTVIDSGYALSDGTEQDEDDSEQNEAEEDVPQATLTPEIHTRESWWRSGLPSRFWPVDNSGDWRGAIVHHTVDRNDYAESEVKAIVQNIYIFHTQTRGWGDIGYNLLVDRFGGIWEGRDEGVANAVKPASQAVGAHTGSFNYKTFGVSVIGSFHLDEAPTEAAIQSVASAIAWEFNALGITDAYGTFPYYGTQQRITGHGDASHQIFEGANSTLCPGVHLSAELPRIRTVVQNLLDSAIPSGSTPVYRLYNPRTKLHHFTTDINERETLAANGWNDERIVFFAQQNGGTAIYRLYNPKDENHLWTADSRERNALVGNGWHDENVAWHAPDSGTTPVYRLYFTASGEHLYTTDYNEYQKLASSGWNQEGIAWQGL